MNIDTFWKLIENAQCKADDGWIELDHNALIDALAQFSADEIQEFDHIFWRIKATTYRADLWEAVSIIACGCGDDAFDCFQNWLISQGEATHEKVLEDPENLADIVPRKHRFDLYDITLNMAMGKNWFVLVEHYYQKANDLLSFHTLWRN